jgi:galactokinase
MAIQPETESLHRDRAPTPAEVEETFTGLFGCAPSCTTMAHGRVNLMGDHTDYNGGFVFPLCIPQSTTTAFAPREDSTVRVASRNMGRNKFSFNTGYLVRDGSWLDYVRGAVWAMEQEGARVPGFDLLITSSVPMGSGLSSSAALLVSMLRALRGLCGRNFDDVELAKLARRAETDFVGAPVGIMDQMAASIGDTEHALFLDTHTMGFDRVGIPPSISILVVDSLVPHRNAAGGYAKRRAECIEAADRLRVGQLREVHDLSHAGSLDPLLRRRVRHVITENARVPQAVAAVRAGDARQLGQIFLESHASLRDDFEVSTEEVDALVEVAAGDPGICGARLTGGGFGGCIVAVAEGEPREAGMRITREYERKTGRRVKIVVPEEA